MFDVKHLSLGETDSLFLVCEMLRYREAEESVGGGVGSRIVHLLDVTRWTWCEAEFFTMKLVVGASTDLRDRMSVPWSRLAGRKRRSN